MSEWSVAVAFIMMAMLHAFTWVAVTRLTDVVRAAVDVHMRTQIAMHKELCRMNDRFTPVQDAPRSPMSVDEWQRVTAARDAVRGGG